MHSVRPVTETERFEFEIAGNERSSKWRSLADVLPKREYIDIVPEEPDENEVELPDLPPEPDKTTIQAPTRRVKAKTSPTQLPPPSSSTSTESPIPVPVAATSSTTARPLEPVNEYELPDAKRRKEAEAISWVDQLYLDAEQERQKMDIFTAMDDVHEPPSSNRQRKLLERNPVAYLVKKMRDSEVTIARLPPHERPLFGRAKAKKWTPSSRTRLFENASIAKRLRRPMIVSGSSRPAGS